MEKDANFAALHSPSHAGRNFHDLRNKHIRNMSKDRKAIDQQNDQSLNDDILTATRSRVRSVIEEFLGSSNLSTEERLVFIILDRAVFEILHDFISCLT